MTAVENSLIAPLPPGVPRRRNVLDVVQELHRMDGGADGGSSSHRRNILIRVDYNVPMNKTTGAITDDSRIRGSLPTIRAVLDANCNAILCSHMGRPKLVPAAAGKTGKDDDDDDDAATKKERHNLSLRPVAIHLSVLLDHHPDVLFAPDCWDAAATVAQLPTSGGNRGGICLLENLRFYPQEEQNDPEMAARLASYADGYVNDAFGTCHRAHASTAGVPALMNPKLCGIGALVASELAYLDFQHVVTTAVGDPPPKIAAIIGGSKVSTKLPVIQGLLHNVDVLILCGGLAFTFLRAMDVPIGSSLVEDSMVDTAKQLLEQAKKNGKQLIVPVDAVCASSFPSSPMDKKDTLTVDTVEGSDGIPDGYMGLDAGPKSVATFLDALQGVTKLIMNGPLGVFEVSPFDEGTRAFINGIEKLKNEHNLVSVVGGGDSVAALEAFGKMDAVSYVSTGGGATLELLAGDLLPGVEAIAMYEE
jgi:phosphoglycerate kinase